MKYKTTVEAFQWTGGVNQKEDPEWIIIALKEQKVTIQTVRSIGLHMSLYDDCGIETGCLVPGWWIIKTRSGDIEGCSDEFFKKNYEAIE